MKNIFLFCVAFLTVSLTSASTNISSNTGFGNGITVSANTALTDVESRGVHVNVTSGKKSMHVEIVGVDGGLIYKPADPTAKSIADKDNQSEWNKIKQAVDTFVRKKKNALKLANVAKAASENYPKNTRDFSKTEEKLRALID